MLREVLDPRPPAQLEHHHRLNLFWHAQGNLMRHQYKLHRQIHKKPTDPPHPHLQSQQIISIRIRNGP